MNNANVLLEFANIYHHTFYLTNLIPNSQLVILIKSSTHCFFGLL